MTSFRRAWLLALAFAFPPLLGGCPAAPGNATDAAESPRVAAPTPSPSAKPRDKQSSAPEYSLGGGRVGVLVRDDRGEVAGAEVSVIGPSLGFGVTGASGDVEIGPLPLGSYEVRVDAAGRAPAAKTVDLSVPRSRVDITADLPASGRALSGHVRDGSGKGLAGARVALGLAWTVSDSAGAFSLNASEPGDATVIKTGYAPATTAGGEVTLAPEATQVSFENDPLGTPWDTAFSGLRAEIGKLGWSAGQREAGAQIRVWAAPATVSEEAARDAAAFVRRGGKLVVLAEWGGSANYSPDAANRLLLPLGVAVAADLVRVPTSATSRPEWFMPVVEAGTPASLGSPAVTLLGACSVRAGAPSMRVLSMPQEGYRVQVADAALPAVGSARQVASGLVVALGDTSAWLDADIGRDGNLSFMRNVLAW